MFSTLWQILIALWRVFKSIDIMPRRRKANQKGGQEAKSEPNKPKHNPNDKSKHNPKHKPKEQNTTKREPVLRCLKDSHLKLEKRHYLLDLHHYCEHMNRAHSNPKMFSQLSHYAENTLYRGDVKHLGDWSKISYLHQEALRAVSVVKEVEVDAWKNTVHSINATYYALIAEAMNTVIADLQDDESSGNSLTVIHMQKCQNFLKTSMQDAKKTVIQEYKSALREKEIAKLNRNIENIEEKLQKEKSESTDGSEDSPLYKKLERSLGNLQKRLYHLQSGKSYQASHAGDLASQAGDLASQAGDSEEEDEGGNAPPRTLGNKFSVDLWGGKGQRTQARTSDLSLKYL
jgi:hypothetical protein